VVAPARELRLILRDIEHATERLHEWERERGTPAMDLDTYLRQTYGDRGELTVGESVGSEA